MRDILITAPARQDPKIFHEHRKSIENLIVPDDCNIHVLYVINESDELIPELDPGDKYVKFNNPESYSKVDNNHLWTLQNMLNVGHMRNYTINYCLVNGFDYWFSVDTDIVLDPHTLVTLLDADKDIVSEVFWTTSKDGEWCNAWMYDQCDGMSEEWKKPGLYRVGMTGACTLVKHKVLKAGVNYDRIPNIVESLVGEDRHFCVRAAVHGFEMWLDTHYPAFHIYTEEMYQKYMQMLFEKSIIDGAGGK